MARESKTSREGGVTSQAFLAACLLTAALMLPHAALWSVLAGMVLAGLIRWRWDNYRRRKGDGG